MAGTVTVEKLELMEGMGTQEGTELREEAELRVPRVPRATGEAMDSTVK